MVWANVTLQGILLGGLYALFATGLALVFGVMRMVNLAHGDLGILAAFIALFIVQTLGLPLLWATVLTIADHVRHRLRRCSAACSTSRWATDETRPIVVTFGLAIIIENALHPEVLRRLAGPGCRQDREHQRQDQRPALDRLVPAHRVPS